MTTLRAIFEGKKTYAGYFEGYLRKFASKKLLMRHGRTDSMYAVGLTDILY